MNRIAAKVLCLLIALSVPAICLVAQESPQEDDSSPAPAGNADGELDEQPKNKVKIERNKLRFARAFRKLVRSEMSTFADFTRTEKDRLDRSQVNKDNRATPDTANFPRYSAERPGPHVFNDQLVLVGNEANQNNSVAFAQTAKGLHQVLKLDCKLAISGGQGMGLAFLNCEHFGAEGAAPEFTEWEEPNFKGSLAIGFDTHNPKSEDWFNGNGNFYGRPEHEVSLHWDGREIANVCTERDYRGDALKRVELTLQHCVGGAELYLKLGEEYVFRAFYIPNLLPYEMRVVLGSRTGDTPGKIVIDGLHAQWSEPIEASDVVRSQDVTTWNEEVVYNGHNNLRETFTLPEMQVARLNLTFNLDAPQSGGDPWDKKAALNLYHGDEEFELLRIITPYGTPWSWTVDITDYQSLLRGDVALGLTVGTSQGKAEDPAQQRGWKITITFHYYEGKPEREAYRIENLWKGSPEYGNPEDPMVNFFDPREITLPDGATGAALRFTATGHGMSPNSENAAEFLRRGRTVTVDEASFTNELWWDNCYLNPCRPQGGTWKFDRAGWAPGSAVLPWRIDISEHLSSDGPVKVAYIPDEYVNEGRGKTWAPHHWFESQIVYFRDPK